VIAPYSFALGVVRMLSQTRHQAMCCTRIFRLNAGQWVGGSFTFDQATSVQIVDYLNYAGFGG